MQSEERVAEERHLRDGRLQEKRYSCGSPLQNEMRPHGGLLQAGAFVYDPTRMRFYKGNEELTLSGKERGLLLFFMQHPEQVFARDVIYEHVWDDAIIINENTVMVYINRLRSKIERDRQNPEHIITVRGWGYRFVP